MCPELFHIGPIPIRGYGVMLALSFLFGVLYLRHRVQKDNKRFEPYLALSYILIFGGVIGARLFYVVTHLDEFRGNWSATFNPFASSEFGIAGLNLYGGILLGIIGLFLYCRYKKMPLWETFDYFAPAVGIGIFFGRIGCFLNGCCFGTPTEMPWGVVFPPGSIPDVIFPGAHLHPAQIYSSLYGLFLFLGLHWLSTRQRFTGQVIAVLLMVEAAFRFGLEYVRYYETEMWITIGGITPTYNQLISITLFVFGLAVYLLQSRKEKATL